MECCTNYLRDALIEFLRSEAEPRQPPVGQLYRLYSYIHPQKNFYFFASCRFQFYSFSIFFEIFLIKIKSFWSDNRTLTNILSLFYNVSEFVTMWGCLVILTWGNYMRKGVKNYNIWSLRVFC